MKRCVVADCERPVTCRGACHKHYTEARRRGTDHLLPRAVRGGGACYVDGCSEPVYSNGRCQIHDQRIRRLGVPRLPPRPSLEERLFGAGKYVVNEGRCWLWVGGRARPNGYGNLSVNNRLVNVHRLSYELRKGPIPDGLTIDHLCRVRLCINPDHLEAVTRAENTRRELAIRWNHNERKSA